MSGNTKAAITMDTVMDTHRVIENSQNVFIEFRLAPNVGRVPALGYTVVCEVVAGSQVAQDKVGLSAHASFPSNQYATLAGCLFALLYRLDHILDDVVAHRAERDAVRLPGF